MKDEDGKQAVAIEKRIEDILRETLSRLTTDEVNALRNRFRLSSDMNPDDEERALRALASEWIGTINLMSADLLSRTALGTT